MRPDDKLHQRAKTPNGRRPEDVQVGDGGFKTFAEPWVALEAAYGLRELRSEEIVFGDVHAVSRSKKNMVDGSVGAIIQLDPDALASRSSGNNGTSQAHRHAL